MTHDAPSVDQQAHAPARGGRLPAGESPRAIKRADVHVRIPADLLAELDARLARMALRPTRTAAIVDAITRWVAWDKRREAGGSAPAAAALSSRAPAKAEPVPGLQELTYERI